MTLTSQQLRRPTVVLLAAMALPSPSLAQQEQAKGAEDIAAMVAEAEPLYMANCRHCHGTRGTAGVPLAGNEKVLSFDWLVDVIMTGPGYMPEFADVLSDEEIAAISTYVMNSWGHDYGPVTPEDVASMRP